WIAERRAQLARLGNPAYKPPPMEVASARHSSLSGLLPPVAPIPDPPSATPESMIATPAPARGDGWRGLWLAVAFCATVIGGLLAYFIFGRGASHHSAATTTMNAPSVAPSAPPSSSALPGKSH